MKKFFTLLLLFQAYFNYSQNTIIDRTPSGGNSIFSSQANDGTGHYAADSFSLTEETVLGELFFYGFSFGDLNTLMTGFNIYIYENNVNIPNGDPTSPNSALVAITNISQSHYDIINSDFRIRVTPANNGTQVILPAGDYWIVPVPVLDIPLNSSERWNWFGSNTPASFDAAVIDPENIFQGGTNWKTVSSVLQESFPSFGWKLTSEEILSVTNNDINNNYVSIINNPVKGDILKINVDDKTELLQVSIFNSAGQLLISGQKEKIINTSQLSSGVYLVKIAHKKGVKTLKMVKE